jgi:hypothetical protein
MAQQESVARPNSVSRIELPSILVVNLTILCFVKGSLGFHLSWWVSRFGSAGSGTQVANEE